MRLSATSPGSHGPIKRRFARIPLQPILWTSTAMTRTPARARAPRSKAFEVAGITAGSRIPPFGASLASFGQHFQSERPRRFRKERLALSEESLRALLHGRAGALEEAAAEAGLAVRRERLDLAAEDGEIGDLAELAGQLSQRFLP